MFASSLPPWIQARLERRLSREKDFVGLLQVAYDLYQQYARDPVSVCHLTFDIVFPSVHLFDRLFFFVLSFRPHETYRHFNFEFWIDDDFRVDERTPEKLGIDQGDMMPFRDRDCGPVTVFKIGQWPLETILKGMGNAGEFLRKHKRKVPYAVFCDSVRPFLERNAKKRHRLQVHIDVTLGRRAPPGLFDAMFAPYMPILDRHDSIFLSCRRKRPRGRKPRRIYSLVKDNSVDHGPPGKVLPWSRRQHRQFLGSLLRLRNHLLHNAISAQLDGRKA